MAWTNISNSNLDIGAPIRSVDILALRDNVSAVPNGDTGAPRVRAEALNGGQSGNAPIYAARAWVNFDGGTSPGTIRASGNVSSVTRGSTGDFTVNFSTAMPDANYAETMTTEYQRGWVGYTKTSTSFFFSWRNTTNGFGANSQNMNLSFFR